MRRLEVLLLVLCVLLSQSMWAGPKTDPILRAFLASTLAANGSGRPIPDSVATGNLRFAVGTATAVFKTKALVGTRVEFTNEQGTQVMLQLASDTFMIAPDGTARKLHSLHNLVSRSPHLPFLSILGEWDRDDLEVKIVGDDTIQGHPVKVVSVALVPDAKSKDAADFRHFTERRFYVDQSSGQVLKMAYMAAAENHPESLAFIEIYYSDYRNVNGFAVPFTQITNRNGEFQSELRLTSIDFGTAISDSDFTAPEVK
jgi:hypothetical protein